MVKVIKFLEFNFEKKMSIFRSEDKNEDFLVPFCDDFKIFTFISRCYLEVFVASSQSEPEGMLSDVLNFLRKPRLACL